MYIVQYLLCGAEGGGAVLGHRADRVLLLEVLDDGRHLGRHIAVVRAVRRQLRHLQTRALRHTTTLYILVYCVREKQPLM